MGLFFSALYVLFVLFVATGAKTARELCATITKIDCQSQYHPAEPNEAVCGSNKKTYLNSCYFAQAKCSDENLGIKCQGECSSCDDAVSTELPGPTQLLTSTDASSTKIMTILNGGRRLEAISVSTTISGLKTSIVPTNSPITISPIDEKILDLLKHNMTRTRKNPPGRHVDRNGQISVQTTTVLPSTLVQLLKRSTESDKINRPMRPGKYGLRSTTAVKQTKKLPITPSRLDMSPAPGKPKPNMYMLSIIMAITTKAQNDASTYTDMSTLTTETDVETTVYSTKQPTTEVDFVLFCKDSDKEVCPETLDPLCGTDNKFYLNICTFNKAKCKDADLKLHTDLSTCRRPKTI